MPDYSQGKIYTIRCSNDESLIYVGSTIQPLYKRLGGHKTQGNYHPNFLLYKTINNDWTNWYIELYENFPCNNKEELCKREGEIIRLISNLNIKIEGRTPKQYKIDNEKKIKENQQQYFQKNKEIYHSRTKEYRLIHKDLISLNRKKHREKNIELYTEKEKEQQIKHREKRLQRNKDSSSINCKCGGHYKKLDITKHQKTKLHQKYLSTLGESIPD